MEWNIEQDNGGLAPGSSVDVPHTTDMFAPPEGVELGYGDPLTVVSYHVQHPEEFEHRVGDHDTESGQEESHDVGLDG